MNGAKQKYLILALVVLVTVLLVWLLSPADNKSAGTKIKHISSDWDKKYQWNSKDPYGLYIFKDLLKDHLKKDSTVNINTGEILDSLASNEVIASYLFVGEDFGLYNEELDTLFSLVEKGSDLFIISSNITENVSLSFSPALKYRFDYNTTVNVKAGKDNYKMVYLFQNDTIAYPWQVIDHPEEYSPTTKIVSSISGIPNCVVFPLGKGKIVIHATPECFFNFQLNRKEAFRYADRFIREFDANKELYYLELARLEKNEPEDIFQNFNESESSDEKDDSYLQFLFRTPALRAALLLSILGIFIFLFFRSKRMQPSVEVLPQKRNMSGMFVQTIASIYRNRDNPFSVLQLHKKNFYDTVQKHYFVDLSKRSDNREIQHLSSRCGVDENEITALLNQLEMANPLKSTEDYLLETTRMKRKFYEQTGIINERISQRLDAKEIVLFRSIWLSFPLLMIGIGLILAGLYLLVKSNGIGILLWPIGSFVLFWAIMRMSRPLLKIKEHTLNYYPLLKRKDSNRHSDLMRAEKVGSGIVLHYKEGKKVTIPYSELGTIERNLLEGFLVKQKVNEF